MVQKICFVIGCCFFGTLVKAQSFIPIELSHYTFQSHRENEPIATILSQEEIAAWQLVGANARLFRIQGNRLQLSENGKRYFAHQPNARLTLQGIRRNRSVQRKAFTIAKETFVQNKVIAHRGAFKNTQSPENSIASLKHAFRLGCTGSEFDIRMTADEVLVINHDPHFQGLDIEKSTFAALNQKKLSNGESIPTLAQFLEAGMAQQQTRLIAEIKPSPSGKERSVKMAEKVVALVHQLQAQAWVEYISFDYDILKRILQMDAQAKVMYLNGNASIEQLKMDKMYGADYYFSIFQKDEKWIYKAHQAGLKVNAWTVNDPVIMDFLLVRDIDFITTNEPEVLLAKMETSALKTPRKLVWSEEFNYVGLPDSTKWTYDVGGHGWGNSEIQYYTKADSSNAFVDGTMLRIKAQKRDFNGKNYTSARLVSRGKSEWKYGKIEFRAKVPQGRGLWPAVWMLGSNHLTDGWPKCGEVDILEYIGTNPDSVFSTVHTETFNWMHNTQESKTIFFPNPYTEFHIFAIEWTPDKIEFFLDNRKYHEFKNVHKTASEWPFDQPLYMILNIAVGGSLGGQYIDETMLPATLWIDYVRVFEPLK